MSRNANWAHFLPFQEELRPRGSARDPDEFRSINNELEPSVSEDASILCSSGENGEEDFQNIVLVHQGLKQGLITHQPHLNIPKVTICVL